MLPYITETFPSISYVNFIDDNSGVHRTRVQDWLAAQPNIRTLDWPAKSPSLNVIENLWGIIQKWNSQVQWTCEALEQHVFNQWESLRARPAIFQNLVIYASKVKCSDWEPEKCYIKYFYWMILNSFIEWL